MLHLDKHSGRMAEWVNGLLQRRHSNVVACALANKIARIAWAIAAKHVTYNADGMAVEA